MSDVSSSFNPFIDGHLPLFEQININAYGYSTITSQIDTQKEQFTEFENGLNKLSYTFSDIFDRLDVMEYPLSKTYGIISHLSGVNDSKPLRDIKDHFRNDIVDLDKMSSHSKKLYDAIKTITTDDSNEIRMIQLTIDAMERGGVNLPHAKKERLTELDKLLSELSTRLGENILDDTKEFKKIIEDKTIMSTVPLCAKELWSPENPEEGPWVIRLSGPSISAALQHLPDQSLRKELYMAYISRAGEKNEEVIKSIMDYKLEKSNILGFENYTKLSLSRKMAKNEETIIELLNNLQEKALPCAINEFKELEEYAQTHNVEGKLEPWDLSFWSERMREEKFQLKEDDLKPYFSLDNVLRELFTISNHLFGIHIEERSENVEKWHKDVRFFDIYDGNDKDCDIVAGFYLDPYAREETKRGGAWMDSCIDKSRALNHLVPVAYLVCNGSPPGKDRPSLLSFRDVETLFHEFGHGLQHMLTKVDINGISGINGIEWDAVELPSQFMENWCYDEKTLNNMAVHYETGEKLPKDMYDNLVAQKTYGAGMAMMRQISFSKLDLYLYSNWKTIREEGKSLWDIQKQIFTECCPYKTYLDEDRFLCSFQHIFSGYSAGYYSYKWAEVMSADSFSMFEENPDNYQEIGQRFKNTILANGGSKPAMETFEEFRGRGPNVDALLRHNKLL
jgi:oligopeptidase A